MTSPFAMFQIKVFPDTDQVCVEGVMLDNADGLWLLLMERADATKRIKESFKPQVFRNTPEVEEFLAKGGRIKKPEVKKPKAKSTRKYKETAVDLDALDDLIARSIRGEL